MDPALLVPLLHLILDPKTSKAVVELMTEAFNLGLMLRDRFTREGSWKRQDALDAFNLHQAKSFAEMHARHMVDGVLTDEERLELAAAWDAMIAALKALPA